MRSIRDCTVCVVGGAGFLGSHLVDHLVEDRGCDVLVVDNLVAGREEFVHPEAEFFHHDITGSEEFLTKLFRAKKVQFVLNYAAFPYVPDSFARPLHVFNVNAAGAIKVINAAQEAGVEAILQVSSAEIYGGGVESDRAGTGGKITEDIPTLPHSTYGVAKLAVDYYCQCSWRERKTPVIALRQFNCLGERETHPYIVPEIIGQLAKQQILSNEWPTEPNEVLLPGRADYYRGVVKLGNDSFRDFLYAGDAVRIAVELLERGQPGEVYNLGSETGIKMFSLAEVIGKLMGFAEVKVEVDQARIRPWEIWSLLASNEKLYGSLGYKPQLTDLETALKKTISWYESVGRRWPWGTK